MFFFGRKKKEVPAPLVPSGLIDVRRALVASSSRVSVADLARQGKQSVSLLSRSRLGELINRAVRMLVDRLRQDAEDNSPVEPLLPEEPSAVEKLQELLQEYQKTAAARAGLEASRQSLHTELQEVRVELARQKARAEDPIVEDLDKVQFLGAADVDQQFKSILKQVFEQRGAGLEPAERKELGALKSPMQDLVLRIVREERARYRPEAANNGLSGVRLLEKRVEKLYAQLESLENALRLLSDSKTQNNQAIQKVLRQLGLVSDDKNFEKKKEMLKFVLDANRDIRKTAQDLESKGITLASPRRALAS